MGALDDAIREHLELKRRHGASDDEIKQAEAEALGPARRGPAAAAGPVVDEVGMPAPAEAIDAPPVASDAVADAPPPPPPPGVEPPEFPGTAPVDPIPAEPESEFAEPLAAAEESIEPHPVEPESVEAHVVDPAAVEPTLEPHPVEPEPVQVEPVPVEEPPVEPPAVEPPPVVPPPVEPVEEPEPPTPYGQHAPEPPPQFDEPERARRTTILDDPLAGGPPPPVHHDPGPDEPPAPARPAGAEPTSGDADEEDVLEETPDFLQETPEHDRLWFEQKPPRDFDFDD
jgi:hypothetical protein